MAEDPKTDPKTDPGEGDDKPFWDKLGKLIDERIDAGVDRAIQKHSKPGQSRTGNRSTLPSVLADIMFGKQTQS